MGLVFFRVDVGPERPKIFYFILLKKVVGMVATWCQIAYEQHISKQINYSNTQGTKHTY
jgi:hypothetical protein